MNSGYPASSGDKCLLKMRWQRKAAGKLYAVAGHATPCLLDILLSGRTDFYSGRVDNIHKENEMIDRIQHCIERCYLCAAACERCVSSGLLSPAGETMRDCLQSASQCATLCRLAAQYLAINDASARPLYPICAQACEACAAACAKHSVLSCRRCAETCRQCARLLKMLAA